PVIITAPVKVFETHCEAAVAFCQRLQYFYAGRDDFATDAITGDCCNAISSHRVISEKRSNGFSHIASLGSAADVGRARPTQQALLNGLHDRCSGLRIAKG